MAFAKASHDNATIELMGKAYDAVLSDMKAANVNLAPGATTMIARRILAAVIDGERDLDQLPSRRGRQGRPRSPAVRCATSRTCLATPTSARRNGTSSRRATRSGSWWTWSKRYG
jgi:hypothetical protein